MYIYVCLYMYIHIHTHDQCVCFCMCAYVHIHMLHENVFMYILLHTCKVLGAKYESLFNVYACVCDSYVSEHEYKMMHNLKHICKYITVCFHTNK